jgi:flagellar biosynthesis regulator FlbT
MLANPIELGVFSVEINQTPKGILFSNWINYLLTTNAADQVLGQLVHIDQVLMLTKDYFCLNLIRHILSIFIA